jgi:integrase
LPGTITGQEGKVAAKLTPIGVERAKPKKNAETGERIRTEVADAGCPGLYLVVQPSGAKSWAVRYRFAGAPKKLTLGPLLALSRGEPEPPDPKIGEPLTLKAAHKLAKAELRKIELGTDPAKAKQDQIASGRQAAAVHAEDSVENLKVQFIERYQKPKNRSWARIESIFEKEVLPRWRGRSVHEITKENVEDLIDAIAADRPIAANRTLAAVRKWFAWMGGRSKGGRKAMLKERLRTMPCVGVEPPGREARRDRVLSDEEIKAVWAACGEVAPDRDGGIGEPFGSFVRVLLLTGQRRGEVAGMRRSEIDADDRIWRIPSARTKNKLMHLVPLSDQTLSIIKGVKRIEGSDFVFTTTGDSGLGGFSRAKERLDETMTRQRAEKQRDQRTKPIKPTPWTFHDLRRTAATGMADIGILPHVIETVLNHVSGHRAGVAGVYNRATYAAEKADALQRWADYVEGLVTGNPAAKVIPIRSQRR